MLPLQILVANLVNNYAIIWQQSQKKMPIIIWWFICLHYLFTFLGPPDDGIISHISSSKQTAMSEDLSSIVSLSDKYRFVYIFVNYCLFLFTNFRVISTVCLLLQTTRRNRNISRTVPKTTPWTNKTSKTAQKITYYSCFKSQYWIYRITTWTLK